MSIIWKVWLLFLDAKYLLCLKTKTSFKAKSNWDGIIEKIKRHLASWKWLYLYLSKGGRITLIKSTLPNLPTYFMSLFPFPTGLAIHIEKLQQAFLWGGIGEEVKFHQIDLRYILRYLGGGGALGGLKFTTVKPS